jgi:hypothetical protein
MRVAAYLIESGGVSTSLRVPATVAWLCVLGSVLVAGAGNDGWAGLSAVAAA